jgi:hypothetical protein
MAAMAQVPSAADAFVEALERLDFFALEELFADDVAFRALVPPGFREAAGNAAAAALLRVLEITSQGWFARAQSRQAGGRRAERQQNALHDGLRAGNRWQRKAGTSSAVSGLAVGSVTDE